MAARERKQKRKARRGGVLDFVNGLLTLVVIAIVAVVGVLVYGASQFYAADAVKTDTSFTVEKGSRLSTIADRLEEQGLVSNKWVFEAGAWAQKKQSTFRAGEYALKAGYSMSDLLREITEGKPIIHSVIVPEGFTSWQVADRLTQNPDLDGAVTPAPEGTILPGSYDYDRGDARTDVLAKMRSAMATQVADIYAGCDPAVCGDAGVVKSPEQLVTLASVVEKETGVASERPQVASVFINRLKKHMRLQSDPTIIYGITLGRAKLDRDLKKSEIETQNAYNTYQMDGLPAGPIANPGVDALNAVAHPANTQDLYFVAKTADPGDGHLFAATYADHKKNVALYRKAVKEQLASDAADAEAAREALEAQQAVETGDTAQ